MDRIKDASQQEKCLEIKSALTPESRRHNRGVLKSSTFRLSGKRNNFSKYLASGEQSSKRQVYCIT